MLGITHWAECDVQYIHGISLLRRPVITLQVYPCRWRYSEALYKDRMYLSKRQICEHGLGGNTAKNGIISGLMLFERVDAAALIGMVFCMPWFSL